MGGIGDAFSFSALSIPFLVDLLGLLVLAVLVLLTRGNALIRATILGILVIGAPWVIGSALGASCQDGALVAEMARFYVGPVALLGPGVMLLSFAIVGCYEKYRGLVLVASLLAAVSCVVTWSTDLVIAGSWQTSWGLWYPLAGPLNDLHLSQIFIWAVVGVILSRRGGARATLRQEFHGRRMAAVLVLLALTSSDGLLARGIGVYPFSVVPIALACWYAIVGIVRHDLLRARGFDRAGAYEIAATAGFAVALVLALWLVWSALGVTSPIATALLIVPLFVVAQLGALVIRSRVRGEQPHVAKEVDTTLEEFIDWSSRARDDGKLLERLEQLLTASTGLGNVRLLAPDPEGNFVAVGAGPEDITIDARVRAWLMANIEPVVAADLATMRLGGLRAPIEEFMRNIGADLVVPLVDRDQLVGLLVSSAPGDRALRDSEAAVLRQAAAATARALTYIGLLREAEARIAVAKEVEVAAAVQYARAAGEQQVHFDGCEVTSYYQPADQFGGHWSMFEQLGDGRILVVMGDVVGSGVSAALVSFTVEGACATAQRMMGPSLDPVGLLELLGAGLRDVGGQRYSMSCFAAVFDLAAGQVNFANAGHPFPYLCRRADGDRRGDQLRALVSRGTPLGNDELVLTPGTLPLETEDVVVFHSDSVVELRNGKGQSYGDRRLQRVLRNRVRAAGSDACRLIFDDVLSHHGDRPIEDDINIIVVRLDALA